MAGTGLTFATVARTTAVPRGAIFARRVGARLTVAGTAGTVGVSRLAPGAGRGDGPPTSRLSRKVSDSNFTGKVILLNKTRPEQKHVGESKRMRNCLSSTTSYSGRQQENEMEELDLEFATG